MRKWSEQETRFNEVVGRQLAFHRASRGLKQAIFADRMGIKKSTLANWEQGNAAIPLFTLLQMAASLRVRLADLVGPAVVNAQRYGNGDLTASGNRLVSATGTITQGQPDADGAGNGKERPEA